MKRLVMKNFLLLFLLFQLMLITNYTYNSTDGCGTTGSITTNSIPTSGTIKVFVVFAQFKDDSQSSTEWPLNTYPSLANDFVSSNGSGPFAYNNLSQYYYSMSNGAYQVEGDVYNSLLITNQNESYYSSIGTANYEILTRVAADPTVDFSQYDNLNGNSFGHDGKVDFNI
ncbi:hypothetical protein [Rosettibacter firmus]|uniref:hypothetical protein n=1 Tax=Rosettibacter firmus TaxID=3111522 RepID=UPI00336BB0A5